jgi:hypothetical protein
MINYLISIAPETIATIFIVGACGYYEYRASKKRGRK